jgi:hypothetical protein
MRVTKYVSSASNAARKIKAASFPCSPVKNKNRACATGAPAELKKKDRQRIARERQATGSSRVHGGACVYTDTPPAVPPNPLLGFAGTGSATGCRTP